jgi:hypothetical protein
MMKRAAVRAAALVLAGALLAVQGSGVWAQAAATITLPAPGAVRQLYPGCNNIGLTFPDATASTAVAQAVTPAGTLQAMWRHNAALNKFEGFSPAAPQASDLLMVDFLDAVWLCIGGAAPAASAPPPAATAPGSTSALPATVAPTDALDSFAYVFEKSLEADGQFVWSYTAAGEFEAPADVSCTITFRFGGLGVNTTRVVSTGEGAWVDEGDGFVAVSEGDSELARHLKTCPGWPAYRWGFSLPAELPSGTPETVNGIAARRYSLAEALVETPASFGLAPSEVEGMTINAFDVWLAEDGGWLVRLVEDVSEDLEASGEEPQRGRVVTRVDITEPNSPDIHVEPPVP